MRSACASSSNSSRATSLVADSTAEGASPAARRDVAASRSIAAAVPAQRRRSASSHASKAASVAGWMPSSRSRPTPGERIASTHVPEVSVYTSTSVPVGSSRRTGSPSSVTPGPSNRRSWARFQRSEPSGSSAFPNRSPASRCREIGDEESSNSASSAHGLWPRGAGRSVPSRSTRGGPIRKMARLISCRHRGRSAPDAQGLGSGACAGVASDLALPIGTELTGRHDVIPPRSQRARGTAWNPPQSGQPGRRSGRRGSGGGGRVGSHLISRVLRVAG
jgi:hypothetical protein